MPELLAKSVLSHKVPAKGFTITIIFFVRTHISVMNLLINCYDFQVNASASELRHCFWLSVPQ